MESPVRIKLGYSVLLIILISLNYCYSSENITTTEDDLSQESTTQSVVKSKSTDAAFRLQQRNNTWLYQKRNTTNIKTSTESPVETTINYANRITFRGSVKYFATRPPFKPKTPFSKRHNITKTDSLEKSEEKSKNVVPKSFTPEIKSIFRRRNYTASTTISNNILTSESSTLAVTEDNVTNNSNRNESSKSLKFGFNINKYTSPEFHNINNVYTQSVSPEVEHFIMPENTSDYFSNIESVPDNNNYYNKDLTTPHTDIFDKRFKEVSDSIKQNLADSEFSNEDNSKTEKFLESEASGVSFEDLLMKGSDDNTKVSYKNTKELTLTDLQDSQTIHRDRTDSNDTKIFYEKTIVSTENYDDKPSTYRAVRKNKDQYDITTLSPLSSNEVINSLLRKGSNGTRRIDHYKNNSTKREFLSTIRMRPHTTPRPKVRISLRNSTENFYTTTRLPQIIKPYTYARRKPLFNTTFSTAPSKLDPVYQGDYSSTRILDYRKSQGDNSIAALKKRGSLKYNEKSNDTNAVEPEKSDEQTSQFNLPPTAAAWALITLKHAPVGKRVNSSSNSSPISNQQPEVRIKTEDELQKLDKNSDLVLDIKSESSQKRPLYEKVPTITTSDVPSKPNITLSEENEDNEDEEDENYDENDDITIPTKTDSPIQSNLEEALGDKNIHNDENESKSSFKSITKLPGSFTTPIYDSDIDNSTPLSENDNENLTELKTSTKVYNKIDLTTYGTTTSENYKLTTRTEPPTTKHAVTTMTYLDSLFTNKNNKEYEVTESTTLNSDDYIESTDRDEESSNFFDLEDFTKETTTFKVVLTTEATTQVPIVESKDVITTIKEEYDDITTSTSDATSKDNDFLDEDDTTTNTFTTSTESNNVYYSTMNTKNTIHDIETASTLYYSSTIAKTDSTTSFTTESIAPFTINPTVESIPSTTPISYDPEENLDSREPKKTSGLDEDDKIVSTLGLPEQDTTTIKLQTKEAEVPTRQIDNLDDFSDFNSFDITTRIYIPNESPRTVTNIEVIEPDTTDVNSRNEEQYPYDSTLANNGDIVGGFEDDGSGAIAAITISVIGVIALLLLIGLLLVARGRRRSGGYGQRCTPVSLDSYSLDNVSVGGSTRRKGMRRPSKRSYGNPAYDESGATSHPMQFAALTNFALDQESVINEFNEIPAVTVRADEVPQGCESKNRYANVVPLPETRVTLKLVSGDETSDYINANFVRGPKSMKNYYIACQAPLPTTVNDFWRMIWEQNSRVILMLTELMENGVEKCVEYIPSSEVSDNKRLFGDFQVTLTKREVREKYAISVIQLKSLSTNVWREVTHMWYFWPAKGVPDECHSIIAFLIEARSYLKASQIAKEFDENGHEILSNQNGSIQQTNVTIDQDDNSNGENEVNVYSVQKAEHKIKNGGTKAVLSDSAEGRKKGGPLIVHCSPGTGRTGTLVACDIGIRDFEMSRTVDVPKTVYKIRRDRANAVQTKDQYIYIYKVLSEYATKLTGGILDSI